MHRVRRTTILWALEPPTCVLWTCWAVRKTTHMYLFISVREKCTEGFAEYDTLQVLIAQLLGVGCWLKVPPPCVFWWGRHRGTWGTVNTQHCVWKEVSDPDGLKKRNSWQLGHFLASACNENNDHSGVSLHFWFLIADQPKPVSWPMSLLQCECVMGSPVNQKKFGAHGGDKISCVLFLFSIRLAEHWSYVTCSSKKWRNRRFRIGFSRPTTSEVAWLSAFGSLLQREKIPTIWLSAPSRNVCSLLVHRSRRRSIRSVLRLVPRFHRRKMSLREQVKDDCDTVSSRLVPVHDSADLAAEITDWSNFICSAAISRRRW